MQWKRVNHMFSAESPSWVPACSSDALSLHFAYGSEAEMSFIVICLKVFFSTDY